MSCNAATVDSKITIYVIDWHAPQYKTCVIQQDLMNDHNISNIPTELPYNERSVSNKVVQQQSRRDFEYELIVDSAILRML